MVLENWLGLFLFLGNTQISMELWTFPPQIIYNSGQTRPGISFHILSSIVGTFYIENDAEIFPAHYTWKAAEEDDE